MKDTIKTPFTNDQVEKLNEFQKLPFVHPFTCCSPESIKECERSTNKSQGILSASTDGWVCPCGQYRQDWAHTSMLNIVDLKSSKFAQMVMKNTPDDGDDKGIHNEGGE